MDKPIIIAICGKSAAGKDALKHYLWSTLCSQLKPAHKMVSDTTRPKRDKEKDGVDYNYLTAEEFLEKADKREYLEYTSFRKWYYGTPKDQVKNGFNIGIFNPAGLKKLCRYQCRYIIIPVYLEVDAGIRLHRMKDREGKFTLEHFRRLFTDWKDFRSIKALFDNRYKYHLTLTNAENVLREVRDISNYFASIGIK